MTKLARIFLVLTALAPVLLVRAAMAFGSKDWSLAWTLLAVAAGLVIVCVGLMWGIGKHGEAPAAREVKDVVPKEADPLAFLVAYALPLVGATAGPNFWGLVTFIVLMALALYQLEAFYVNPLLAVFGFKFFGAKASIDDAPMLLVTRRKSIGNGTLQLVKLSEYLWLH